MAYKILSLAEANEWEATLERLPSDRRDVYFTPEYYSLYENNGDGQARCFVFEEDGECVLYPFLMNSVNALGYEVLVGVEVFDIQGVYGYNGILTSTDAAAFVHRFHKCFDQWCQESNVIAEFSRFHPLLDNQRLASPLMTTMFSRHTVKLNLQRSIDDIWKTQISSKNRNLIRKAEKESVVIAESNDYELFRKVYDQTMENVGAEDFYFFPQAYYDDFRRNLENDTTLCFAMRGGEVIAGSLFMYSPDYGHYHLSGRDKAYSHIPANNLLLWYGIQKAKARGCKWFHFGGGTTSEEADPLLHFKKNFSKEQGEFWIGKRIHNQEIYSEVVRQWKEKHPESYAAHRQMLLGYREI